MAKKVQSASLDSRAARAKLERRGKPHYVQLDPALHLGYRRPMRGPGRWIMRLYDHQARSYRVEVLKALSGAPCAADDYSDSNGADVLSYFEAVARARTKRDERSRADAGITGPYTVAAAMADYFRYLETDGRGEHTIRDARYRANAFILPTLGHLEVSSLPNKRFRRWRDDLVKTAPRLRTKRGGKQQHREATGEDADRARKSSANRTWTILRAALNYAFTDNKVPSDSEWRKVRPFRKTDVARPRYLTIAEAQRLINACKPDFRALVQAALHSGARYGELARLRVTDFKPDPGTLYVGQSKSGKSREIELTEEGIKFFTQLCVGRSGDEVMLRKADGTSWRMSHQLRPMADAVTNAKIAPTISFHGLRHTWASHAVMNGVPLIVVAHNLGHGDTRMVEKHYATLAESYIRDAIRAGAPKFGVEASNVVPMVRE